MRSVLFAGAILALVSSPLVAQSASSDAPSPDSSGHWEVGLYPTARKLTYDLAAKHEWGGGATLGLGYRFSRVVSLNAEFLAAWIPQLNTVSQGQANELMPTLALQLQVPGNTFRPYVVLGGGHESFHFAAPRVPGTNNLKFWTGHTGVGFRLKLANWAALRTEANAQISTHRPSWGAFSGVSFYPGARKSAPMMSPPIVQHDTVTLRMVDTLVKVDTLQVNTHTQVTTSDTVTRTVRGHDVILVLRDANFDVGKSALRPAARVTLDSLARELNRPAARSVNITVTGYTDSVGSEAYNMKLGMARAESVKNYLASKGVDASRMIADSKGEADPVATNATPAGRQLNRRVVIGKQ
ncbi:MAG: OmpA family protein [Gemmatimonadaceae bacterium]|nr:OmpA family protein [Gemmatimonadaceae bacterium]